MIEIIEKTTKKSLGKNDVDDLEVVEKGLCCQPVTKKGTPILTRIRDEDLCGLGTREEEGGVWLPAVLVFLLTRLV